MQLARVFRRQPLVEIEHALGVGGLDHDAGITFEFRLTFWTIPCDEQLPVGGKKQAGTLGLRLRIPDHPVLLFEMLVPEPAGADMKNRDRRGINCDDEQREAEWQRAMHQIEFADGLRQAQVEPLRSSSGACRDRDEAACEKPRSRARPAQNCAGE